MERRDELRRFLAFLVGTLLVAGALVRFGPRLLGLAAGPENEVVALLKATEVEGLELLVPSVSERLVSTKHHFDRLSVTVEEEGRSVVVRSTLDFTGKLGATEVSSLGVERIDFRSRSGEWRAEAGMAPRLVAIVSALERRRRALDKGRRSELDALAVGGAAEPSSSGPLEQVLAVTGRKYEALGWYVRSEREKILVREEFLLTGSLPNRPVHDKGAVLLTLVPQNGGFLFENGLM